MLGLGIALTNFGTKGGISDIADGGLLSSTFLSTYGPYGMVMDFTDASITIDDSTDVLDYSSQGTVSSTTGALLGPGSKLTYSAPSAKLTEQADGYLSFQAHNLLLRSEDFGSATWQTASSGGNPAGVKTANYAAAPDGSMTACRIQLDVSAGAAATQSQVYQSYSGLVTGAPYAKEAWLRSTDGTSTYTIGRSFSAGGGEDITVTGTWTKITTTYTAVSTSDNFQLVLIKGQTSNTADILIWHPQVRRTPSVSTYVATPTVLGATTGFDLPYVYSGGVKTGILVEPAATNLCLRSNEFDNASWTKTRSSITADNTTAPDGTTTADKLLDAVTSGTHVANQTTTNATAAYTASVYAKAGELSFLTLEMSDNATGSVVAKLNLSTGALDGTITTGGSWSSSSSSITSVGNGWYRLALTSTRGAGTQTVIQVGCYKTANTISYAGTGTEGIYIWGAQLETGTVATSPIITYGSSVLRAADDGSIAQSLFPALGSDCTIFVEATPYAGTSSSVYALQLYTNGSNFAAIRNDSGTTAQSVVFTSGALVASPSVSNWTAGTKKKVALRINTNNTNICSGGTLGTNDTSCAMPTYTTLFVGSNNGVNNLGGIIHRIAAFPRGFSDSELQAVST